MWLHGSFLGSFGGEAEARNYTQTFDLELTAAETYVITVVMDHMGLDLNFYANTQSMKNPRGILNFSLW